MGQKHFLTKERLEELKQELEELKGPIKKDIAEQLAAAIEMGDLSENAAYDDAKNKQADADRRIFEIQEILENAVIIEKDKNSNVVSVGSKLLVEFNGEDKEFTIVGSTEADPLNGKISNESPLGKNFLGKKVKDVVEIEVPKGIMKYKIKKIS